MTATFRGIALCHDTHASVCVMTRTNAARARRFLRRNRLRLAVAAVFVALAVNVAVQDGAPVLIVLLIAGLGCVAACALPAYITTASAVKHSVRTRQAIEAREARRQELDR